MLTNYFFVDPIQQPKEIVPKGNTSVINLILNPEGNIYGTNGIPRHCVINNPDSTIVSFGTNRVTRQEERNYTASMSLQAYNFLLQNPGWVSNKIYITAFENIDAVVTTALLDVTVRECLFAVPDKLQCLIMEVNEYVANRYSYARRSQPTYLNNLLNKAPFFTKAPDKTRFQSLEVYYIEQLEILMELKDLPKIERVYPDVPVDILQSDSMTMLVTIGKSLQEKVDVVGQQIFSANPGIKRVIVVRNHYNASTLSVTVLNSTAYTDEFKIIPYPPIREMNEKEKEKGGSPEWKNNKTYIIGPKKGTELTTEELWENLKISV